MKTKKNLSIWSEISISVPNKPKLPIFVGSDAVGEITNHMVMTKTKTGEKPTKEGQKSPKTKASVRYLFIFVVISHTKKSLEGKFQKKIQTAFDRTESTIKTNTGTNNTPKVHTGPTVSD